MPSRPAAIVTSRAIPHEPDELLEDLASGLEGRRRGFAGGHVVVVGAGAFRGDLARFLVARLASFGRSGCPVAASATLGAPSGLARGPVACRRGVRGGLADGRARGLGRGWP